MHFASSAYKVWASDPNVFFVVRIPYKEPGSTAEIDAVHDAIWEHMFEPVKLVIAEGKNLKINTPMGIFIRNLAVDLAVERGDWGVWQAHQIIRAELLSKLHWKMITVHGRA